jgi:two-component system chemotaxis sensor kinase CheA
VELDQGLAKIIRQFAGEAQDLVSVATQCTLLLETGELTAEQVQLHYQELGRSLHTLKGTSATLGLDELAIMSHHLEDLVAPYRAESKPLPRSATDLILRSLDALMGRLHGHAEGRSDAMVDLSPLMEALAQATAPPAAPPPATALELPLPPAAAPEAPVPPPLAATALEAEAPVPTEELAWRIDATKVGVLTRDFERLRELQARLHERQRELQAIAEGRIQEMSIQMLRSSLRAICNTLDGDNDEAGDIVNSLEEDIKAISSQPVRVIVEPFHRAVRDLCRQLGKEARLNVVGGELTLDRRVLEALRGPLVHLIRNALDHGVEKPDVRELRGKHREAMLTVRVELTGNLLSVEVSDDGGGINLDKVRAAAEKRGLFTAAELDKFTEQQLQALLFVPGFSTQSEVTDLSGRGVGLDVVRQQLKALSGNVEVHSVEGQGTRFALTLPIEMGGSSVMVVRCGEAQIGLPMLSIETILRVKEDLISAGRSRVQLHYQEKLLPVADLGAMLALRQSLAPEPGGPLLILQSHGRRVAVTVDSVVGHFDVLIRALSEEVRELPAYQGAATLSRGEMVLVLRPDWVVAQAGPREGVIEGEGKRRALVVDDSLAARALLRASLESGGFTVHLASSGLQALQRLKTGVYDLMVCDVGMAEMDGLTLLRQVRSREGTRTLPVVVVSGKDSPADRAAAFTAGASGFLSKADCASGRLLAEVNRVIAS